LLRKNYELFAQLKCGHLEDEGKQYESHDQGPGEAEIAPSKNEEQAARVVAMTCTTEGRSLIERLFRP